MRQKHSTINSEPRSNARAGGLAGTERDGSALVLVIGALALISVFAAIYLAIGRSDRQNASALKQRSDINEYSDYFSSYLSGVIGDDRMDVYPILSLNNRADKEWHREVTDYPYTDWTVRSQPDDELERFYPSGRHLEFNPDPNDTRVPYDPWLASTEPEYLGSENITGASASGARYYSATFNGNTLRNGRRFLDNRDWRQISNLAPDARFVNLWNLRPGEDPDTNTYGGFDAKPGLGTYTEKTATKTRLRRSMTYGLSLLQRRGNTPYLEAFDPTETGLAWVQGYDTPQPVARELGVSNQELANVPAVWTMNQRFLFSPANQPFVTYERSSRGATNRNGIANWTSPDFMPYQYADADGDGMYDSRWIELIDASDPEAFKNLLPFAIDDLRLFAAVRVEDLSARVNVNVAGDSLIAPSQDYPIGLTPSEIDLRRLLATEDISFDTGMDFSELDTLPIGSDAVQNYQEYDAFTDKRNLRGFFYGGGGSPSVFANALAKRAADVSVAEEVGRLAYDAIRLAIETADAPGNEFFGPRRAQIGTTPEPRLGRTDLITGSRFQFTPVKTTTQGSYGEWVINNQETPAKQRTDYYDQIGGNLPKTSRDKISPLSIDKTGEVFGLDDLAELLTFKGLNDPRVMSRLELTTGGRADLDPAQLNTTSRDDIRKVSRRFDPLMSNRTLEIDRFGHGDGRRTQPLPDAMLLGDPLMGLGPVVSGTVDPDAMFLLNASPRLHLTSYSGVTPLPVGSPVTLDQQTLRVPTLKEEKLATPLKNLVGSTQIAFSVYAQALLKDSAIDTFSAWREDLETYVPTNGSYDPRPVDTAFYGYRGPELALRLAGHLSVNLQDMVDEDSIPSAATLLIDQDARNNELVPTKLPSGQTGIPEHPFPWQYNNQGLAVRLGGSLAGELQVGLDYGLDKLPTGRLDATDAGEKHRRVVNVFGVEPQPVLTEVAILNVFTDAPEGAGGDMDSNGSSIGFRADGQGGLLDKREGDLEGNGGQGGGQQGGVNFVTLKTSVPDLYESNPDFLMQALVFQVHNPYPETITFVGTPPPPEGNQTPLDSIQFSHYLEYAGRFFRLGSYSESEPDEDVVPPAEPRAKQVLDSQARYQPVTLGPGETAVFYALMNEEPANGLGFDWERVEDRVKSILNADGYSDLTRYGYGLLTNPTAVGDDDNQFTGLMQEWFENNLARDNGVANNSKVQVHRVREISPATGEYVAATRNYRNLAKKNPLAVIADKDGNGRVNVAAPRTPAADTDWSVRLWRVLRKGNAEEDDGDDNIISNDFLCDRLEVGNRLMQEFNNADTGVIRNTVSLNTEWFDPYTEPRETVKDFAPAFERNDNTGWTIAQWAGVRRQGRSFSEFGDPGTNELIRGVVSPAMIAGEVVEDELDPKRSTRRRRVDQWSSTSGYPSIDQFEDLAQLAEFKLIDSPNFKYRLIDMLRMKSKRVDPGTGFVYEPFTTDDSNAYVGDTKDGPVLQGMALQPYAKFEGLQQLNNTIAYYDGDIGPITDSELPKPVVNSSVAGSPNFDLDYSDSDYDPDTEIPDRVSPDVSFGLKNVNDELRYTIRPTDLLTPFAVGPIQSPDLSASDRSNESQNFDPDAEWITFPEMLSISLGYRDVDVSNLSGTTPAETKFKELSQLYGLLWLQQKDTTWSPALDSGKLRLDDYIRFFDMDVAAAQPDPAARDFPGNFTPGVDRRRGSGIPIALELLGDVRGVGSDMREIGYRAGVPNSAAAAGGVPLPVYSYNERFDNRTDMVVGKININTAPESVLRLLPGLAPSAESYDPERDSGYAAANPQFGSDWTVGQSTPLSTETGLTYTAYGTPKPDAFVTDGILDTVRDTPDRAALLTAYRDRKRAWPRLMSDPVTVMLKGSPTAFSLGADFTPFTIDSPEPWRRLPFYDNDPSRTALLTGVGLQVNNYVPDRTRQILTGIPGLRETPGFSSPGEVLAVTLRRFDALETPNNGVIPPEGRNPATPDVGNDLNAFDFNRHNLMTGLGYDGNSLKASTPYYTSDVASYDTAIYKDGKNDAVVDENDERVAIAGAIMNSIDVRSDTFVVWFVLQGYRPEDVADLRPTDPLVPSFQRRYMMIVDRSNVISENDTPKIVMIREVPM